MLWSAAAAPVNAAARLTVAGKEALTGPAASGAQRTRPPVLPPTMTLSRIRREAAATLPGCTIRRLLFWRYLLVLHNTAPGPPPAPTAREAQAAGGAGSSAPGIDE